MTELPWPLLPSDASLADGEVWTVSLDLHWPASALAAAATTLSPDERTRAQSHQFARDRDRFVAARAALRRLLARVLDVPPARIQIASGVRGKPGLAETTVAARGRPADLHFNLSHSDDLALIALARGRCLGVDVERLRPVPVERLAEFVDPEDASSWLALPETERTLEFFHRWTRNEALVKATGEGLSRAPETIQLVPSGPGVFVPRGNAGEGARFTVHDLRPADDAVGALAVEGAPAVIRCWSWPD